MRKFFATLVIVLIVCMASAIALTACKIELKDMDGEEYYTATEKERSVELVNEYFEEILKNPDFVVTCKDQEGNLQYTEKVKGTDSYILFKDGSEIYVFKKGNVSYVTMIQQTGDKVYYCSDSSKKSYNAAAEEMYKSYHCSFMNAVSGMGVVKGLSEEKSEFFCSMNVERISGFATSTLDFTYTADKINVTITADAEEKNVQTARVVITDAAGGQSSDLTWSFAYSGATFTLPDVDSWDK